MSRFERSVLGSIWLLLLACFFIGLAVNNRLKHMQHSLTLLYPEFCGYEGKLDCRLENLTYAVREMRDNKKCCRCDKCDCNSGKKKVSTAPPSCPRSKFCPCTPPCMCSECRCGGALPAPGTPLTTAVVHDRQVRIAWINDGGRRQECTLTEEEFDRLNAKD